MEGQNTTIPPPPAEPEMPDSGGNGSPEPAGAVPSAPVSDAAAVPPPVGVPHDPAPVMPPKRGPGRPSNKDKANRAAAHAAHVERLRRRRESIKKGAAPDDAAGPSDDAAGAAGPSDDAAPLADAIEAASMFDDAADNAFGDDPLRIALARALAWKRIVRRDAAAQLTKVDVLMIRYSHSTALYGWELVRQMTETWAGPDAAACFVPDDLALAWTAPFYKLFRRSSFAGWVDELGAGIVTVSSILRAIIGPAADAKKDKACRAA